MAEKDQNKNPMESLILGAIERHSRVERERAIMTAMLNYCVVNLNNGLPLEATLDELKTIGGGIDIQLTKEGDLTIRHVTEKELNALQEEPPTDSKH